MIIRDHVEVLPQPTVVRLEQLQEENAGWISRSYCVTEEIERHLHAVRTLVDRETGCGIFLIGHFGSGKSHFLAYLSQQLERGELCGRRPQVRPISLLHFRADQALESIVREVLGIPPESGDRRKLWKKAQALSPEGIFLALDELSEFLRAKPSPQSFAEDLRFLQFLGEWAQTHPFWIGAALQEQIEHTGAIEFDLYRKIKDRYPVRLILSPAHVHDLIAGHLLRKKEGYRAAVERLAGELASVYPEKQVDWSDFCEIYPLHPMTLALLEEVRDRFSQARGMIDFALTQLLGNEARRIPPFLDEPWGSLLTPDRIVDHFADLFEVQPEFLAIAQKVLPYYRRQLAELFPKKAQQELAWRLLKLLILVHLSPARESLGAEEAARWLLYKVSSIDPDRNRQMVERTLDTLAQGGAFVSREKNRFVLLLEDEPREHLEQLVTRTVEEIRGRGDSLFEELIPLLTQTPFDPFELPRERWHKRQVRWCFHERPLGLFFGGGVPPEHEGTALQVGLPWGPPAEGARCFRLSPTRLDLTPEILELAALRLLGERPLPPRTLLRLRERLEARRSWFASQVRSAYQQAALTDPSGGAVSFLAPRTESGLQNYLNTCGETVLRLTYPSFERFAPSSGPLPREAYRQLMKWASEGDLVAENAPEYVRLIREAYLVPMGLMQRRAAEYVVNPRLDRNELVQLVMPVVEHHPKPERIYEHLGAPVFGLVQDQVHLLLLVLLIQGEIDIVKGEQSYRDIYETLLNPLQYDRVIPGTALDLAQVRDLEVLCDGFRLNVPRQWSVMAQKRAVQLLQKHGARQRDLLLAFLTRLRTHGEAEEMRARVGSAIEKWMALDKGEHELQGFRQFLFEIGSPQRFVAENRELASLPDRFDRLARESQRFLHLFGFPCVAQCGSPEASAAVRNLGAPPTLDRADELERWIEGAQRAYALYSAWYRTEHEKWRHAADRHPAWEYRPPAVARSRHLPTSGLAAEIETLRGRAERERCRGISGLDFQAVCRCGFNGSESALSATLARIEEARARLETELRQFFQQEKVRARVRQWVDQRVESNERTLSYLEGGSPYPEIHNTDLFDRFFSGVEAVRSLDADSLVESVIGRVWDREGLLKAVEEFCRQAGDRFTLRRSESMPRRELVAWCCEQALRTATPLPAAFTAAEQKSLEDLIRAEWVGEAALARLEQLGLGEAGLRRILTLLLDGAVAAPRSSPAAGPVAAALELLRPAAPHHAEELGRKAAMLYGQNSRFLALRPGPWLSRLNALAEAELPAPAPALNLLLRERLREPWIVVDCFGLPLLASVKSALPEALPHWRIESMEFGQAGPVSTTNGFYGGLIQESLKKGFFKVNGIDVIVHERDLDFAGLERLAKAELEVALRGLLAQLEPSEPIVLFGDHGFRLSLDGKSFTHGGASTLERVVPIIRLAPI